MKNSTSPLFVASRFRVEQMTSILSLLRQEDWQSVYVDPSSSEQWIRLALWDYHGSGPIYLHRGNPSIEEIFNCLEQNDVDNLGSD